MIEIKAFDAHHMIVKLPYLPGMQLRGLSRNTIKAYLGHVDRFMNYSAKHIDDLHTDDLEIYLLELLAQHRSHTCVNQVISALKLFFHVCERNDMYYTIPRPKKIKTLPDVLSQHEVLQILNATTNVMHKTMLFITYSSGLRVSEVVRLRLTDIDYERQVVSVKQGKGRKDRHTLLSQITSDLIHLQIEHPHHWLFPGDDHSKHIIP